MGQESLRHQMSRHQFGESRTSRYDPRAYTGRGLDQDRHTRVPDRRYSSERDMRRRDRERDHNQAELEYRMQREREREHERERRRMDREPYSGRSERRGAVTAHNNEHLAQLQMQREQRQREYDKTPANVRRHGLGYFPAYEYR